MTTLTEDSRLSAAESEAPVLDIRLFGPFEARVHGQPLGAMRSPRIGQYLITLLALRHDCDVERAWLAATLWPDCLESQALYNLNRNLTHLRHALGPEAGRLQSPTMRTLRLDLAHTQVDLLAFDAAIERNDPSSLEQAIALYRGPLLEGSLEEWILQERLVHEQSFLGALQKLAVLALERGDPVRTAFLLRRLLATDPLREDAHRLLMQALAANGEYAAVVQVYRDLRLLLHRELRTEPDPQTTALYRQIRAESQQHAQSSSAPAPPAPTAVAPSQNSIPHPLTELIGRKDVIQEIHSRLAASRLVTLTGAGGVGKTRLAIQVARELKGDYPDGVWFVELAALSDPDLVPQQIASVLKIREEPGHTPLERVTTYLQDRSLLLVLDNCEHLLEACVRLIQRLLQHCSGLRMLATSRQSLGLTGEAAYRVPSMTLPTPKQLATDGQGLVWSLMEYEAIQLFVERANQSQALFKLTPDNAPTVVGICRRLDGIPLALELAAARVRSLSVEEIDARLDDRFRLLTGGSRTALPRQQTWQALIDWSYDLLTEPERALLRRLCVFSGGWTLDAAEFVCCADEGVGCRGSGVGEKQEIDYMESDIASDEAETALSRPPTPNPRHPYDVLDLLTSLVDKSLVMAESQAGITRYSLLQTVRQYALDRLIENGEEAALRSRHYDYFLMLAQDARLALDGPEQVSWLERLETEHDNLRAALSWSLEEGRGGEGEKGRRGEDVNSSNLKSQVSSLSLASALCRFWDMRGYVSEGRAYLQAALSRAGASAGSSERAEALYAAGILASCQGDYAAAGQFCRESLAIRQELGDQQGMARALDLLGLVAKEQGDLTTAREQLEQALRLHREIGNRASEASALSNLGDVAISRSDYEQARSLFEQALNINREVGDRAWEASNLSNLGDVAQEQGQYAVARHYYEQALTINREINHRYLQVFTLIGLGNLAQEQGEYRDAFAYCRQALQVLRELELRANMAEVVEILSTVAGKQRQAERAARLCGIAESLRLQSGRPLPLNEREQYERDMQAVRSALGEEIFTAILAQGHLMTFEQAIEYALCDGEENS